MWRVLPIPAVLAIPWLPAQNTDWLEAKYHHIHDDRHFMISKIIPWQTYNTGQWTEFTRPTKK